MTNHCDSGCQTNGRIYQKSQSNSKPIQKTMPNQAEY